GRSRAWRPRARAGAGRARPRRRARSFPREPARDGGAPSRGHAHAAAHLDAETRRGRGLRRARLPRGERPTRPAGHHPPGPAGALEMAVEYGKVREQFGRKIGSFQAIKHMAAEMAAEVEPTRSLVWYAAYGFDHRLREAPRAAAIAKARLGEVYCRTVERSLQLHG